MKRVLLLCVVAIIIGSCKHEKDFIKIQSQEFRDAESAGKRLASADSCVCLSQAYINQVCDKGGPEATIINQFLNHQSSVTYTVTWAVCTANPSNSSTDPNCNTPYSNVTSRLTLCWHSCTTVGVRIHNKPPCLPCYPDDFCFVLTPQKITNNGHSYYVLTGSTSLYDVVQIRIEISSDPDIIVECSVGPVGNQTIYSCNGSF